ncbi:MAG: hypothetical protein IJK81_05375 [Selenomonadaceae bacterium]|nr:hypothetical protein [Selenomonadaceae bacterium]
MPAVILYLFVIIPGIILAVIKLLPYILRIVIYVGAEVFKVLYFLAEKFSFAIPWIISAGYAIGIGFYALGRQFFTGENARDFLEEKLPPREVPRDSFSLMLIELMLVFHEKF